MTTPYSMVPTTEVERWHSNKAFVYFGRLAPSKGIHVVLECWLDLVEQYAGICPPLWIIGGSQEEVAHIRRYAGLEEQLTPHERTSRLMWWGYLDPAGVSAVLLRTLVLVTHSHYEPGGRVILEAMRQGVPSIATPHGFAPDLIADWVSGFLVPYEDRPLLRQRLSLFMHQPMLASALGTQARMIATAALAHWEFFPQHYAVYDSIGQGRSIAAPALVPSPTSYPSVLVRRHCAGAEKPNLALTQQDLCSWAQSVIGPGVQLAPQSVSGKSLSWIASSPKGSLWIKQIHSHFRLTPAWLQLAPSPLIYTAGQKWAGETSNYAAGVVPTIAANQALSVIAMPVCVPVAATTDAIQQAEMLRRPLDVLASTPVPAEQASLRALTQQYSRTADLEYQGVQRDLLACPLNAISFWPITPTCSARLYLRLLILGARQQRLLIPAQMHEAFLLIAPALLALAAREESLPIVWLHHNAVPIHFAHTPEGELVLLDKERLSYGFKGKDQAELAAALIVDHPAARMEELLNSVSDTADELAVIRVWTGLHLLTETGECLVTDRRSRLEAVIAAWDRWRAAIPASQ